MSDNPYEAPKSGVPVKKPSSIRWHTVGAILLITGIHFIIFSGTIHSLAIQNCLVVTIIAVFRGGSMWVIRKRLKELATDE